VSASVLAWLLISKYEDHLLLCRNERILDRLGVDMPRSKISEWMMQVADLLAPLVAFMRREVLVKSAVIGADQTPIGVLNSASRTVSQGWLWVSRGHNAAPYTILGFNESRGAAGPRAVLAEYGGWLVTDGDASYQSIVRDLQKDGLDHQHSGRLPAGPTRGATSWMRSRATTNEPSR
jgi:hypothetical protein